MQGGTCWIIALSSQKNQPKVTMSLRARKGVAISWYNLLSLTQYQEIAASGFALLAMTVVIWVVRSHYTVC